MASWTKPWYKMRKALHHSPTTQGQDASGINPLPTRHQPCKARCPLTRKGALRPHPSMRAWGPMWMPEPPLRPDVVTGTRPSLNATVCAEAEGMTPSTTAAHHLSLQGPAFSARPSAGPNSKPGSNSQQTSPSTQGRQTLSSG